MAGLTNTGTLGGLGVLKVHTTDHAPGAEDEDASLTRQKKVLLKGKAVRVTEVVVTLPVLKSEVKFSRYESWYSYCFTEIFTQVKVVVCPVKRAPSTGFTNGSGRKVAKKSTPVRS